MNTIPRSGVTRSSVMLPASLKRFLACRLFAPRVLFFAGACALLAVLILVMQTRHALLPLPGIAAGYPRQQAGAESATDLLPKMALKITPEYFDRYGRRLNTTYRNYWNLHRLTPLHEIPEFLRQAFVLSEDKRFYSHDGPDWLARLNALKMNLKAGETLRGASTISEQVVRMLHPRPRTIWSRWLEGFEAGRLEAQASKADILEFYLNQVPFQNNRRGVREAAAYYFNRDLDTLSKKEMLALTVFVRSPYGYDPQQRSRRLEKAVVNLAERMARAGVINAAELDRVKRQKLQIERPQLSVNAEHLISYLERQEAVRATQARINTTLDAQLQSSVQQILDTRLNHLAHANVGNGAVLVVDHRNNEILAWVVGHAGHEDQAFNQINAVVVPRQPGSALKPFVYAQALAQGWTAATLIEDAPLEEGVGSGMHTYNNYSRGHYGLIALREALGNSLNIPAVKAMQKIGAPVFLDFMYRLGVRSLNGHPNLYGDGIALGNGEMTLFELVEAYAALARMGDHQALSALEGQSAATAHRRVLQEEVASLIGDILSDPAAREKEFGRDSLLNFAHQTAVKTGTSSDYRDAWAMGYDDRYTVGVWMGNLDYAEMHQVTGGLGPAIVLRSVFNLLGQGRSERPLYLSPGLQKHAICVETGMLRQAGENCEARDEWFISGHYPETPGVLASGQDETRIRKPSKGLQLAMDPRIPDHSEYFEFELSGAEAITKVEWYVNETPVAVTQTPRYPWQLSRGKFVAQARVWLDDSEVSYLTPPVSFKVN